MIKEKWRPITMEDIPNLKKAVDDINTWGIHELSIKLTTEDGRNDVEILDETEELYYGGCWYEKTLDKLNKALVEDLGKGSLFDCICPGRYLADYEEGRCLYTLDYAVNHIRFAMSEAMFNYMRSNGIKYNWTNELREECDNVELAKPFADFMKKLIATATKEEN